MSHHSLTVKMDENVKNIERKKSLEILTNHLNVYGVKS